MLARIFGYLSVFIIFTIVNIEGSNERHTIETSTDFEVPQSIEQKLNNCLTIKENIEERLKSLNESLTTQHSNQFKNLKETPTRRAEKKAENFNQDAKEVKPPRSSCAELLGVAGQSGVYQLEIPNSELKPFYAYCLQDPDNGTAWTIIQKRIDGSIDFNRDWFDYKRGFGNIFGEYFIGLDKLHALTYWQLHELLIQTEDFHGEIMSAKYQGFAIENEAGYYALSVVGPYTGNVGDCLRHQQDMLFSTKDADNDNDAKQACAVKYKGGWWYNSCEEWNLNGYYDSNEAGRGITWVACQGFVYYLKHVQMAIRPII